MKARSGTKAAVCSNLYATDKRGARRAQILIYNNNKALEEIPRLLTFIFSFSF